MPETTQVNLKLPISQKRDWEQYVDETEEATSLSHLIRLSVEREISDEHQSTFEADTSDLDVQIETETIERRLDSLENIVREISGKIDALETSQLADTDEVQEIADFIYDTIPRRSAEVEHRDGEMTPEEIAQTRILEDVKMRLKKGVTIKDLAEDETFFGLVKAYKIHFDADDYTMQRALERVQEYSSRVHVIDDLEHSIVFEIE